MSAASAESDCPHSHRYSPAYDWESNSCSGSQGHIPPTEALLTPLLHWLPLQGYPLPAWVLILCTRPCVHMDVWLFLPTLALGIRATLGLGAPLWAMTAVHTLPSTVDLYFTVSCQVVLGVKCEGRERRALDTFIEMERGSSMWKISENSTCCKFDCHG